METKENSAKTEMTLLEAIERIVELSKDSKLSPEFMESAHAEIKLLADKHGIIERQAVLFAVCMEVGPYRIDYDKIGKHLGLSKISMLKNAVDIEALVHRGLLRCSNANDEDEYKIESDAIRCLKHNEVYQQPKRTGLNCAELFGVINQLFSELDDESISLRDLKDELNYLFNENKQLEFIQVFNSYNLFSSDRLLLLFFCHKYVNEDEDSVA